MLLIYLVPLSLGQEDDEHKFFSFSWAQISSNKELDWAVSVQVKTDPSYRTLNLSRY